MAKRSIAVEQSQDKRSYYGTGLVRQCKRFPILTVVLIGVVVGGTIGGLLAMYFTGQTSGIGQLAHPEQALSEAEPQTAVSEDNPAEIDKVAKSQEAETQWSTDETVRVTPLFVETDATKVEAELRQFEWYSGNQKLQTEYRSFPGARRPRGIALSDDGSVMLVVTEDDASAWDVEAGKRLFIKEVGPGHRKAHLYSTQGTDWQRAAVSPDGSLFAATYPGPDGGNVRVWDRHGTEQMAVLDEDSISGKTTTFSPDGAYLVVGGMGCGWESWETTAWRQASPDVFEFIGRAAANPQLHPAVALWFAGDGELHSFGWTFKNMRAWDWGENTNRLRHWQAGYSDSVLGVSPDLKLVLPYEQRSGPAPSRPHPQREMDLSVSVNVVSRRNELVIAGCRDMVVRVWRVPLRHDVRFGVMQEYRGCAAQISAVALSPARVAAACEDGTICVWASDTSP